MPVTQHGDYSTCNIENVTDVGGDQVHITQITNITNVTNVHNGIPLQKGKSFDRFGEQNDLSFGKSCVCYLQSGSI